MSKLAGTQTEKNILAAFAGESQARNRYSFFASKAKKDGFEAVSYVFEETASQEREHASRLFKMLEGGEIEITAAFPAGVVGTSVENLLAAAAGEQHENTSMYPDFAKVAREEGFDAIAKTFEWIAVAEKYHERRFRAFAKLIQDGTMFKRGEGTVWRCRNCGYNHTGAEAPTVCPACAHPQAHFEILSEKY